MKVFLKRNWVLYFWAIFDFYYIARFVWLNISHSRIPLVDDIFYFSEIYQQQGAYSLVFFFVTAQFINYFFCSNVFKKMGIYTLGSLYSNAI